MLPGDVRSGHRRGGPRAGDQSQLALPVSVTVVSLSHLLCQTRQIVSKTSLLSWLNPHRAQCSEDIHSVSRHLWHTCHVPSPVLRTVHAAGPSGPQATGLGQTQAAVSLNQELAVGNLTVLWVPHSESWTEQGTASVRKVSGGLFHFGFRFLHFHGSAPSESRTVSLDLASNLGARAALA